MTQPKHVIAVVPAAGVGSRMQSDRPKQYMTVAGKTILEHTLNALISHPSVIEVVVALDAADPYFDSLSIAAAPWLTRVDGGKERADSVYAAVRTLQADCWALVHDAARPCVSHDDISRLLAVMDNPEVAGGILATPVRDTMKRASVRNTTHPCIAHTESRENLWHALTPQLFNAGQLTNALQDALAAHSDITDEASAMERLGYNVALVEGSPENIKITRPGDMPLAAFYLSQQQLNND